MGTSSNQRSPDTPNWRLARALIGNDSAPVERQSGELWRAATSDHDAGLLEFLCSPRTFAAATLTQVAATPRDAANSFFEIVKGSGNAPFLDAAASRALLRTVAKKGDARQFAGELLSEAVAYYASRELPSYLGRAGRVKSASGSIELKAKLGEIACNACAAVEGRPARDAESWASFMRSAIKRLIARRD